MQKENESTGQPEDHYSYLNADFWNNHWKNQQMGWDIGYASPPIVKYTETLTEKNIQILVPGCGNAWEAEYLAEKGFTDITILDISEEAVHILKDKFQGISQIKIVNEDFFRHHGTYDLIIEQTFFCAIPPTKRNDYARHSSGLLSPNGKIVGVMFDRHFERQGPPFGGSKAEYQVIFSPYFDIQIMESCYNSISPRAGAELFIELIRK